MIAAYQQIFLAESTEVTAIELWTNSGKTNNDSFT